MNLKVANLIAVQFGIFVGIMFWLGYSRFPSAEPRAATEMKGRMVNSIRPEPPLRQPRNPYPVDNRTDRERPRPMDEQLAPTEPDYDQESAPEPYASYGLDNGSMAASPSYAEVNQQSAGVPADYPAGVPADYYQESPPQIFNNSQAVQIVAFSNPRRFANRGGPAFRQGAINPIAQQFPDRGNPRLSDTRIVPVHNGPNAGAQSCPLTEAFMARRNVRQSGVTGCPPKRAPFPASSGAPRRSVSAR